MKSYIVRRGIAVSMSFRIGHPHDGQEFGVIKVDGCLCFIPFFQNKQSSVYNLKNTLKPLHQILKPLFICNTDFFAGSFNEAFFLKLRNNPNARFRGRAHDIGVIFTG